jgi:hypothetical protein
MKKIPKRNEDKTEQIELLRGGSVVSSLTGAFGRTIKETRLTAVLGYLMALEPTFFLDKFGFKGAASSISLESNEENGRSDIRVETTKGIGIIEAKLGWQDPYKQSTKYKANWRVLLTQYRPSEQEKKLAKVHYICWSDIGRLLIGLNKSSNWKTKFISRDILNYLEANNMTNTKNPTEIYAKEINEPNTLKLFLKACLYGENYKKNSRLTQALYFAPHFGKNIRRDYPGVHCGISYIAKIEGVELVDSWKNLQKTVQRIRGKSWLKKNKSFIDPIKKSWSWKKGEKRYFLFLGEPHLVFNPPIKKECLQKGAGFLQKRFRSFDELFSAWQGGKLKISDNE